MNYETIQRRIQVLIEDAERKPKGKVDAALEPLRETLLEARRKGVRLRALFDVVQTEGGMISPSSFAKYAQRHLQVRKTPERTRSSLPSKQESRKLSEKPVQPLSSIGKPRIATGNY